MTQASTARAEKATELLTYKSKLDEVEKRWLDITNARDGILAQKLIPEGGCWLQRAARPCSRRVFFV